MGVAMRNCVHKFSRAAVNLLMATALLVAVFSLCAAQEEKGVVQGVVKDAETGEPVPGANVVVVGSTLGSTSNADGFYNINNVPAGRQLIRAGYIGFRQIVKEIVVSAGVTSTVDFNLSVTSVNMNEIVVTGQGAAIEKRKLATSIETISSKELSLAPSKSLEQLLQGHVPGLTSYVPSAMPGTGARIATRGVKSVLTSSTPVIYVDGVRVDNNDNFRLSFGTGGQVSSSLSDLLVGNIERIEVIKGGAASTLYGSEAANGVIQIFTAKGAPGAERWKFSLTSGFDKPENKFILEDYTKEKFLQTGIYQSYAFNTSGGTEYLAYSVSGKISGNQGVVTGNKLEEKVYSFSSGARASLSDQVKMDLSASYTRDQYGRIFNDNAIAAPLSSLEIEGTFRRTSNKDSLLRLYMLPDLREAINRFITTVNFTYTPIPDWMNKFTVGLDYRKSEERQFAPIEAGGIVSATGGFLSRSDREYMTVTLGYAGSYKLPVLDFVEQTLSFGVQGYRIEDRESYGRGRNFGIPGSYQFSDASTIDAQENNQQQFQWGIYGQDQVGLWDRVFLDLGIRFDGNSAFGKDIGIQTYPKAGIAYNIGDESYWPDFLKPTWSSMKLRTSWGQTGSFPPPFVRDRSYTSNSFLSETALNFGNAGDTQLKPEKTTSIDIGFDAGLFDDRVALEFTYFRQTTKNAFFSVPTDPASGFGVQIRNVGEIQNKGIELTLRANVLNTEDVDLNIRASLATLDNEVTDLGGAPPFSTAGFAFAPERVELGRPVGIFRVDVPRLEADGTYKGNSDQVLMGTPLPTRTGSFSFDLTLWKDLSISSLLEFATGNDVLNQSLSRRIINGTVYPDELALLPVSTDPAKPYTRNTASSILIQNGAWWKLREISARYRLPFEFFRGITLTASLRNVAIFGTKTTGVDPELSFIRAGRQFEAGGVTGANISPPRQFRFGAEFSF